MKSPEKIRAKLEKQELKASRDLAVMREKAARKITKIEAELREEEARIDAHLTRVREKAEQKLELTADSTGRATHRLSKSKNKIAAPRKRSTKG